MIALSDIQTAITNKLKTKFPAANVIDEEVERGFKKPAFFVQLLPVSRNLETPVYVRRVISTEIQYLSLKQTRIENMEVQDQLEELFGSPLVVGDRYLLIDNVEAEIVDKELNFSFEIDFIDNREEEPGEYMENLNLKEG